MQSMVVLFSYIGVRAFNETGDLKLDAQSHRFVAELSETEPFRSKFGIFCVCMFR